MVTSGASYIGNLTCKELCPKVYTPVVYDNLMNGNPWAVRWGPLERGDISERNNFNTVIENYQPEAVIHFEAYDYVGKSITNPGKY